MAGWVKIHREIGDKPIWLESTSDQRSVLMALLMMVNYEPNKWEWQGEQYECMPGQVVTSLQKIAEKSGKGVSIQNVRTALKRFEKLGFLTNESTNKNRLITIVNWGVYQGSDDEPNKQTNRQLTSNQQAANKQLTTIKNIRTKEVKNKEIKDSVGQEKPDTIPYGEIIDYLNQKAGKSFKHTAVANKKIIKARWNEGYRLEDFKRCIDNKVVDWKDKTFKDGTDADKFLQPSTLFGNKFDQYLNQKPKYQRPVDEQSQRIVEHAKASADKYLETPIEDNDMFF